MNRILGLIFLTFYSTLIVGQTINTKKEQSCKPFVLGEILELQSKVLSEQRTLNIYLPEGYNAKDSVKYPVIYLLDGSADEDFIHIVGLVQYNSFEWINQVPKSIVVGIATVDRRRDYTFVTSIITDKKNYPTTGHSDKFISFIETELQPYIENKYKTTQSKTIIGQSLGGLFATEVLFKRPGLFTTYIIISPSVWWDNGSLLHQDSDILNDTFTQKIDIYIGVGKEGLTPTEIPRVMEVDANLLAEKIRASKSKTLNVLFDYLPQENHATVMHQAVLNAFKQLNFINKQGEQSTKILTPAKPSSALEKTLIQEMYNFSNAWGRSDTATLSKLLAPEYRHSDVFGEIQDRNKWLIFAANKRELANLEINDIEILLYYDNLAVITGKMSYLFGKEKIKQDLRFTQIFGNYNGQWKRTAFQGTYVNI